MINSTEIKQPIQLLGEKLSRKDSLRSEKDWVVQRPISISFHDQNNISLELLDGVSILLQKNLYEGIQVEKKGSGSSITIATERGDILIRCQLESLNLG